MSVQISSVANLRTYMGVIGFQFVEALGPMGTGKLSASASHPLYSYDCWENTDTPPSFQLVPDFSGQFFEPEDSSGEVHTAL